MNTVYLGQHVSAIVCMVSFGAFLFGNHTHVGTHQCGQLIWMFDSVFWQTKFSTAFFFRRDWDEQLLIVNIRLILNIRPVSYTKKYHHVSHQVLISRRKKQKRRRRRSFWNGFFFKVYLNYLNSFMIRKYFHISKIRIHLY